MSTIDLKALPGVPKMNGSLTLLLGTSGAGKTTTAASWPGPRVAHALESGSELLGEETRCLPYPRVARVDGKMTENPVDQVIAGLRALASQPHEFKSYILDSFTELLYLTRNWMLLNERKGSIEMCAGGWGKGYTVVAEDVARLIVPLRYLARSLGMHVVITCHVEHRNVDMPDLASYAEFFVRGLRRQGPSMGSEAFPFIETADLVGLIRREGEMVALDAQGNRYTPTAESGRVLDTASGAAPVKTRLVCADGTPIPGQLSLVRGVWPLEGLRPAV